MLVKSLLLAVILSVVCIASSASTTVEAYSVKFNNGSELTLDPKYFTGSFPNMQQNGLAPNKYAWQISLLAASNFNGACTSSYYAAMGSSCDQTVFPDGPTSTLPNSDGTGVQIVLQTNFGGNSWQATYNVICDPTATTLKSPSNSYQASHPATTIVVAFTMTSAGACLPPPPTTTTATTTSSPGVNVTFDGVLLPNTQMKTTTIKDTFSSLLSVTEAQIYVELSPTNASIVLITITAANDEAVASMKQKVADMPRSEISQMGFSSVVAASTSTPAPTANTPPEKNTPIAAIVGGVIGSFVVGILVGALIYRSRATNKHYDNEEMLHTANAEGYSSTDV